jgi:hypothetical protein
MHCSKQRHKPDVFGGSIRAETLMVHITIRDSLVSESSSHQCLSSPSSGKSLATLWKPRSIHFATIATVKGEAHGS